MAVDWLDVLLQKYTYSLSVATIWLFATSYCYCFISVLSVHLYAHYMPNFRLGPLLDICPFNKVLNPLRLSDAYVRQ